MNGFFKFNKDFLQILKENDLDVLKEITELIDFYVKEFLQMEPKDVKLVIFEDEEIMSIKVVPKERKKKVLAG